MKKATYNITGMSCAACSSRIERVLSHTTGIVSTSVNLTASKAYVSYDPAVISETEIINKIEKLGFGVASPDAIGEEIYHFSSFIVAAVCTLALMYVSMGHHMLQLPLPAIFSHHTHPLGFALLQLALTLPVLVAGRRFYLKGWPLLFRGSPNMDTLVALGTSAALVYSLYSLAMIADGKTDYVQQLYFETSAMIVTLVLLGKCLEERARGRASGAVRQLLQLAPDEALIERDGAEIVVPTSEVQLGEVIIIRSGAKLPLDGVVISGNGSVNEAMLTGESLPREVEAGDEVTGGTVNVVGTFRFRVTRVGSDTMLAQIARLMEEAQAGKAPIARTADKAAAVFVPVVLSIALISALAWLIGGYSLTFCLRIFVAVLVIACPCALGLATPTALTVAMGRAAQLGILVKSGAVLEAAAHVRQIVLDKTGTVTEGRPSLRQIVTMPGVDQMLALTDAYALEKHSEHPLAHAVISAAEAHGIEVAPVDELQTLVGRGVSGKKDGHELLLGNAELCREKGINVTPLDEPADTARQHGGTAIYLAADNQLLALLVVADEVKAESAKAIASLHNLGLSTVMLTGDDEVTAQAVAREVGIGQIIAGVLPEGKTAAVRELEKKGKTAMIGDGVNDAPALSQATVGMAVKNGSDIAIEAADVVFMRDDLLLAPLMIRLSRATLRNIRQNLVWAFCYNVAGIPIAAGLLYLLGGPLLHPVVGAAAMSLSSVCVVSNALRLRRFK